MDPELKELLDKANAALASKKETEDAINEIRSWGADGGRLKEAEDAIREVQASHEDIVKNIEKRIDQMQRQIWSSNGHYRGSFRSEEEARSFALTCIAASASPDFRARSKEILKSDHGDIYERSFGEERAGTAHTGENFLVPNEHYMRVQRLVEDYGVFPRLAYNQIMTTDSGTFNRRTSGLRARKTKSRSAVTEQTAGWEPINLTAEDFDILVTYPNTLNADALVSIAELLVQEMALGFAIAYDEDGFIGDATSDYDEIMGITPRLVQINGTDDGGGLVLASGSAWANIVTGDVQKLIGQARYIRPGRGRLICSNEFYWQVLAKHIMAAGGITKSDFETGPRLQYFGAPVEISPVMPRATGSAQVPLIYGDVYLSSTVGNRQNLEMRESKEAFFTSKEVALLASDRKAINNHTLGDATTAGPVVGLITQ